MSNRPDWEMIEQHYIQEWQDYYSLATGLCGCGSDEVPELLDECLRWAALDNEIRHDKTNADWAKGFYRSTAHELAAKILDASNLLEHGTGIGWAWATDDGKKLLGLVDKWRAEKDR